MYSFRWFGLKEYLICGLGLHVSARWKWNRKIFQIFVWKYMYDFIWELARCWGNRQSSWLKFSPYILLLQRPSGGKVCNTTPAYPHRVWALWWQGGKRRLLMSLSPCWGRLSMLKSPSCQWRWVPGSRSKFGNWPTVPSLYSWNIAECDVKPQPTNQLTSWLMTSLAMLQDWYFYSMHHFAINFYMVYQFQVQAQWSKLKVHTQDR